jgi:transitional endoplasmic reticulum ATPase
MFTATHSVAGLLMLRPMPKTTPSRLPFRSPYQRLIALWVLRAFDSASAREALLRDHSYADDDIARFLGLPSDPAAEEPGTIRRVMDGMLSRLERAQSGLKPATQRNFDHLAATLKLSPVEQRVAEILACVQVEMPLSDTWRVLRHHRGCDQAQVLARVLKVPKSAIDKAISPGSRMTRSGLLEYSSGPFATGYMEYRSDTVARHLLREPFDAHKILRAVGVIPVDAAELRLEDFPHLRRSLDLLLAYLRRSPGKTGINILLHGPPGTGKTQLARTLGAKLSLLVYEMKTSDDDGEPLQPNNRLAVLSLAQKFFQNEPVLLVFDEAEDILTPTLMNRGAANTHKGWFNQMLGSNNRPVCWISNSIETLDPAFARRFDFVIEVPVPPRSVRGRILREQASGLVSPRLIEQLTDLEHLAPAVVTRARDVVRAIRKDLPKDGHDEAFTHVLGGILKAQGHPDPALSAARMLSTDVYDITYLNTDGNLAQMAELLKETGSARLCLHGPPGTGKTAFGHWLAREIERPLHVRRGSDLLSPFVGGTEKQIASVFEKALDDDAILMIDEVDSFLQDRAKAVRSWEVTQVNELLTRMEAFNGVFIATTNRLEHLDAASLRRFDLKLHFGHLKSPQIRELLHAWCRSLGIPSPGDEHRAMIEAMEYVTPGDFAAVARRHRFQPFADAGSFLEALAEDCAMKTETGRRIGFQ